MEERNLRRPDETEDITDLKQIEEGDIIKNRGGSTFEVTYVQYDGGLGDLPRAEVKALDGDDDAWGPDEDETRTLKPATNDLVNYELCRWNDNNEKSSEENDDSDLVADGGLTTGLSDETPPGVDAISYASDGEYRTEWHIDAHDDTALVEIYRDSEDDRTRWNGGQEQIALDGRDAETLALELADANPEDAVERARAKFETGMTEASAGAKIFAGVLRAEMASEDGFSATDVLAHAPDGPAERTVYKRLEELGSLGVLESRADPDDGRREIWSLVDDPRRPVNERIID